MIRTLFRLSGNFPVHPDTLHIIWIFCNAKYPETLQAIMNLSQKLSGFVKTFRSALLTRWRGFCDSVHPITTSPKAISVRRKKEKQYDREQGFWFRKIQFLRNTDILVSSSYCEGLCPLGGRSLSWAAASGKNHQFAATKESQWLFSNKFSPLLCSRFGGKISTNIFWSNAFKAVMS